MKRVQYQRCLSLISVLFGALFSFGCDFKSTHKTGRINDIFCSGQTVSVVVTHSTKVSAKSPIAHGGGHLVSELKDSWIVYWNIRDNQISEKKPTTHYIGRMEAESVIRNRKRKVDRTGISPWSILSLGTPGVTVLRTDKLKILKGVENNKSAGHLKADKQNMFLFTQTRKHVFSWLPKPTIYSIPELKNHRKLTMTKSLVKFKNHCLSEDIAAEFFTNDLSWLITIPHNNEPNSQPTKVYCYNIINDEMTTIYLKGLGDVKIEGVELIDDKLYWLVYHFSKGYWSIIDSHSNIISTINCPSPSNNLQLIPFWDSIHELIWFVYTPEYLGESHNSKPIIHLLKHNLKDGTQVKFELPAYDELVVPE